MSKLEKESSLPQTVIAVLGDTGSGKSSLINAVLEHGDILPTSGIRACTSVIVRVSNNASSDSYEADVQFLAKEEWMGELKVLLKLLTLPSGKLRTHVRCNSDLAVALNKVRAVYGHLSADVTLETLQQRTDVTMLGQTKHISLPSVICCSVFIVNNNNNNTQTISNAP